MPVDTQFDISQLLGIPFREGGRDHAGADCYGLAKLFFREHDGIEVQDIEYEELPTSRESDVFEQNRDGTWQEVDELRDGDLVTFTDRIRDENATHCGIFWRGSVLHTGRTYASVLTPLRHLRRRLLKAYRPCRD